jgi:peroxiredoxin
LRHLEGLAKGDRAPGFTLKDQNGEELSLSQFKGKRVILSFHPLAWTSICAKQMESLEANQGTFKSLETIALGLSVDSVPSKKAWAESLGIEHTRLLSDFWPHGEVAQAYGNFIAKLGFSGRANVIIDENGKIFFSKVYELKELPDIQEIIDFLRKKT